MFTFFTPVKALVGTSLLAAAAYTVRLALGPGPEYARIFPPPWLGLLGCALALVAAACAASGATRACTWFTWTTAVVFFGASGGVVLDAFRGFFAVTGIPAGNFATVDGPGLTARALGLLAALTAVLSARRSTRHTEPVGDPTRHVLTVGGVVLTVPYPALKLVWWMQGDDARFDVGPPVMELIAFALGALWLILLNRRAARTSPLVRIAVAGGGWFASLLLISMGALMVFGLLGQATHVSDSVVRFEDGAAPIMVFIVYVTWLVLGVLMLAATVSYTQATRTGTGAVPPVPARRGSRHA